MGIPDRVQLFTAVPESVRAARQFMRRTLEELDVPEPPLENAILLGNELVTNAVQHARTPFEVRIDADERLVRVEVQDADPRPARPKAAATSDTSGRGLAMVDLVADRWGVDEHPAGKTVWAELLV